MLGLGKKNSLNDYEKGMVAGSKPFIEKYQQYADALNRLKDETQTHWQSAKTVVDGHTAEITAIQKQQLFHLNTQSDIKEMADHEKELLTAILYTLAGEQSNENQQAYIRSVQNYLGIRNAQGQVDLSAVENIENIASQKAVLQACIEYLFLAKEDASFFEEYNDSLFCHFNVNDKTKLILWENAVKIYTAAGPQGLAEKYGFVLEIPDEGAAIGEIAAPVELERLIIENRTIHISAGETKEYTAKEIQFNSDIDCHGSLVFDRCVITYNGDEIKGKIRLSQNSSLTIKNCMIVGNNNPVRTKEIERFLVEGEGYGETSVFTVENTLFYDCLNFANKVEAHISDCIIRYSKLPPPKTSLFVCYYRGKSKMVNCLVESLESDDDMIKRLVFNYRLGLDIDDIDNNLINHYQYFCNLLNIPADSSKEKVDAAICAFFGSSFKELSDIERLDTLYSLFSYGRIGNHNYMFSHIHQYSGSTFKNIVSCLERAEDIKQCQFFNCFHVISPGDNLKMDDCTFKNCGDIIKYGKNAEISRCQFFNCSGNVVSADKTAKIIDCYFNQIFNGRIEFRKSDSSDFKIKDCHFDGIYTLKNSILETGFISCNSLGGDYSFSVLLEDCEFKHCMEDTDQYRKIVKQYSTRRGPFNYKREIKEIEIRNCPTYENVNKEGYIFEDVKIWTETGLGVPIGARFDEAAIGVPGVSPDIIPAGQ